MKRFFCLVFFVLALMGCDDENPDLQIAPFRERATVETLENVRCKIGQVCGDSALLTLDEVDGSRRFVLDDYDTLDKIIDDYFICGFNVTYAAAATCTGAEDTRFIKLIEMNVSGEIKDWLAQDSISASGLTPLVLLEASIVDGCIVEEPEITTTDYPLQNTEWKIIEIIEGSEVIHPRCEDKWRSLLFSTDTSGYDDSYHYFDADLGTADGCYYQYSLKEDNHIEVTLGVCILAFYCSTSGLAEFDSKLQALLADAQYMIDRNFLTISSNTEDLTLRAYAQE